MWAPPPPDAPYLDPSRPVAVRVQDLLDRMTPDEKFGQMTLMERLYVSPEDITNLGVGGAVVAFSPSPNTPTGWADTVDALQRRALASRLRIPMLVGADAVHGHGLVVGSTVFPHNIGLGATRDPALVHRIGRAVAEENAATGAYWAYAPTLSVVRDDRWGRTYESFGETPALVASMTTAITGLQGTSVGAGQPSVLATGKHYLADGGTVDGHDRGDTRITEAELRATHLPAYAEAVRRDLGAVMVSYSSWNGVKMHANKYLLTDVLKGELGFDGIVMSDLTGIDAIDGTWFSSPQEVATAINAGIDVVAGPLSAPLFIDQLRQGVNGGAIPMSRIDDAVRRILTKKFELGLFEHPFADRSRLGTVGSAAHRTLARQAVRQSQVLLKNANGVLPLSKSAKVFVAGKSADNIGYQSGGWTITWQGGPGAVTPGTSILGGIRQAVTNPANVTFSRDGTGVNGTYDVAVAVIGETPYAEYQGDRHAPFGNLQLDAEDVATLTRLQAAGIPVVVVMVSGRPLDVASRLARWDALLAAWLPGTEGNGVSDVLFGDHKPTGKLPVTWMQDEAQQPINVGDGKVGLFPYGFGLTYP